ncbi:hypothetical protein BGY98DRAFT_1161748 [Russula aff. rugulosa BPL654]|nr:hypothetical protein BGY98DRAFT_1161748 [Russula aff. rugulosa BPL654]
MTQTMLTFSVQMTRSVHFSLFLYMALLPMLPVCTEPTEAPPSTTAPSGPTEAANASPAQTDDDDGNVGGVLNVAPSPTAETEHVRRGVHEILRRPLHNNQNIIDAPVPDWLVCRRK